MRFNYGKIPESPDFDPPTEGWSAIKDPSPLLMNVLAIPAAFLMLALTIALLSLVWKGGPEVVLVGSESDSISSPFLPMLATIALSIPVHEFVHALGHPRFGLSSNSVLGLWLTRALFYAHYEGELSRNRFLLILALPVLVLSLLPIAVIAVAGSSMPVAISRYLAIVALINSILAAGDAVAFALAAGQIPTAAIVRNKGWKSFWRPKAPGIR